MLALENPLRESGLGFPSEFGTGLTLTLHVWEFPIQPRFEGYSTSITLHVRITPDISLRVVLHRRNDKATGGPTTH